MENDPEPEETTPAAGDEAQSPRARAATLADVARLAGVVPMTASRALNQTGYVSEGVRERVLAAAREVRYRPNVMARQLRSNRLNAVGIVLPDIANPFSAELVRGLQSVFGRAKYTAFIATAGNDVEEERCAVESFLDHRVDGLVMATGPTEEGDRLLRGVAERNVPVVAIGRVLHADGVDCVTADFRCGVFDAAKHLLGRGHRRIGFLGVPSDPTIPLGKFEGYREALEQAGVAVRPEYCVAPVTAPAFATEKDGYDGLLALMGLHEPPTAVLARNDYAAVGALHAAYTRGKRVPEDVAIVGFDDISLAAYQTPPLTTVSQPISEQGVAAAEMLLKRTAAAQPHPQVIEMECRLVVRGSTGL